MDKMKALVVRGLGDVQLEKIPAPVCKEDDVLIKIKACGMSGLDLPREFSGVGYSYPIVIGHEFAGEIVQVGKQVKQFVIGDRVTAAPLLPCGNCPSCKSGKLALCNDQRFLGARENGAIAEYISVKAENVIKLPEEVDSLSGAMIEPTAVAIRGIERLQMQPGSTAVIFGAGTNGLLYLQCLKAMGAGKTYVVDISREKLKLAKELGADEVLNAMEVDIVDYMTKSGKPNVVIETAMTPITRKQSIEIANKFAKILFIGKDTKNFELQPFSFEKVFRRELEIIALMMSHSVPYPGKEWTTAISYIKEEKVRTKPLIKGVYKLEDGIEVFKILKDRNSYGTKVMFEI